MVCGERGGRFVMAKHRDTVIHISYQFLTKIILNKIVLSRRKK